MGKPIIEIALREPSYGATSDYKCKYTS